jgi:hypothetical protein
MMTTQLGKAMLRPALLLACFLSLASPALADTVCIGSLASTTIRGNLIVPGGASCTLTGVLVTGNVQLQAGAVSFTANSTYIFGDVSSQGGAVTLTNSSTGQFYATAMTTIGGNLQVSNGSLLVEGAFVRHDVNANGMDWVAMGGISIGGNLQIQNTTGVSPEFGSSFVCGATLASDVQLQGNGPQATFIVGQSNALSCPGNTIVGNVTISNNQAAVTVSGNIVLGNLQCQHSSTSGSGNTVGGTVNGCTGL